MTVPDQASPTDHRRLPRKRGDALRHAVFDAVLDELHRAGWAGFRIEAVAEQAHVSKASVYRRWPGKTELIMDAVSSRLPDPAALPETGTLRGDLLAIFGRVRTELAGPAGEALRGIVSGALSDPVQAELLRQRSKGRGVAVMREIVARAARRGELDDTGLTTRQLEVGHGMLRHHFLMTGEVPESYLIEVIDEVLLPLFTAIRSRPEPAGSTVSRSVPPAPHRARRA